MRRIHPLPGDDWAAAVRPEVRQGALAALEAGQVLHLPSLAFPLREAERRFLSPAVLGRSKNVRYNPATGALGGTACRRPEAEQLQALLRRYADAAQALLRQLLPPYGAALVRG